MQVTLSQPGNLATLLEAQGYALDLRCGGAGTCGRCRVTLLQGEWRLDGKVLAVPAEALACRVEHTGAVGLVEIPEQTFRLRSGQIVAGWQSRPLPKRPGVAIAVDIGTTTLAAVRIEHGEIVARAACFNAQSRYGDNVIARLNAATLDLSGVQRAVLDSVRELLTQVGMQDVERIVVAGNTVMSCIFHGIDPSSIGVLPFTPPVRRFPERRDLFGDIPVLTLPCISGFVGGDLTAGFGEIQLKKNEMLVDIGTNCEIIFAADGQTLCTAAAAGPAFEGAGLHFGSRANAGAIDHYYGAGNFSVLEESAPCGICGSAYIDFLAVERRAGRLNEFGRYQPKAEQMPLTDTIFIHEYDIEQLLKAKAAVFAGITTLEQYAGTPAEKIYLAGGFARHLNLDNAIAIGMLPQANYEIVGNLSLAGAARTAVDPAHLATLEALIDIPREVPLNLIESFEDNFIDALVLP